MRAIPNKSKRALKPRDATPTGKRREECVGVGARFLYKRRRCAECCAFSGRIKRGSAAERQLALLGRGYQQRSQLHGMGAHRQDDGSHFAIGQVSGAAQRDCRPECYACKRVIFGAPLRAKTYETRCPGPADRQHMSQSQKCPRAKGGG